MVGPAFVARVPLVWGPDTRVEESGIRKEQRMGMDLPSGYRSDSNHKVQSAEPQMGEQGPTAIAEIEDCRPELALSLPYRTIGNLLRMLRHACNPN